MMLYLSSGGKEVRYGLLEGAGTVSAGDEMILERESANLVHIDTTNDTQSSIEGDRMSMSARPHIQLV
jgi:hypothetical protein